MWLLFAALAWSLLGAARLTIRAGDGLAAQYYANPTWSGSPSQSVIDPVPSMAQVMARWGSARPQAFSVAWSGFITVTRGGSYRFTTISDDASWLYVDDRLVIDDAGSSARRTGDVELSRGSHRVLLKYVQYGGHMDLAWFWAERGGTDDAVPAWALSRHRASAPAALAVHLLDRVVEALALLITAVSVTFIVRGVPKAFEAARSFVRLVQVACARWSRPAFIALVYAALLFLPRGEAGLLSSIVSTTGELVGATVAGIGHFTAFQANLSTPGAGRQRALPQTAQEVLLLLERHPLTRYQLSSSIVADDWDVQQVVTSAWPRTLEPDAADRFLRQSDPIQAGCTVIDKEGEVTLVHCP